jgi:hypothetical protein
LGSSARHDPPEQPRRPGPAENERRRLEAEARSVINPFLCGRSLSERTCLDAGRLNDWVLDLGLAPPSRRKSRNWAAWWKRERKTMSEFQREKMWEALDRVRFYEVVAGPVRPVVYVVVEVRWHYSDQDFNPDSEGGNPHKAFRTREAAESYCRDKIATFFCDDPVYLHERLQCLNDPLGLRPRRRKAPCKDGEAPQYDIIEVEVER